MSLLDRVKAIREKHNAMAKDGTSQRAGWVTIDNMLADAIRDYEPKNWPPPVEIDDSAFYHVGEARKRNPKDLNPEDVPPVVPMPPECYEYRNW